MGKDTTAPAEIKMMVTVPIRKATHAYKTNHVNVQLNRNETERLADVFSGLQRDGATVRDGRLITTPNMVLVYLLENLKLPESEVVK